MKTLKNLVGTILIFGLASAGISYYAQIFPKPETLENKKSAWTYDDKTEVYGYFRIVPETDYFTSGFSKYQQIAMDKEDFNRRLLYSFGFINKDFELSDQDKNKIITNEEINNLFKKKYSQADLEN